MKVESPAKRDITKAQFLLILATGLAIAVVGAS